VWSRRKNAPGPTGNFWSEARNRSLPRMPKYSFHIDSPRPYVDQSGTTLPDDQTAWREARRFVRDIEDYLQPGENWRLEVMKDDKALFLVTLSSRQT
jgi:hypothetical protein